MPEARKTANWLVFSAAIGLIVGGGIALRKDAGELLRHQLTYVRPIPDSPSSPDDVAYVLGGTPESLEAKFRIAASLLREGKASRVLLLSQQSLMAYSPALDRNLTVNEWAVQNLGALGIKAAAIDIVGVEEGFFGTWSEAKALSRVVSERGYRRLILVTSAYHSRRVWESFSRSAGQSSTTLFLYHSDEPAYLRHLLPEYVKLLLYRAVLF